jgi:predicted RecB family nuclease
VKKTITKSDWLAAQKCLGMAWYAFRADPSPPDEAGLFRMQQGQEVGSLARKLYPDGVLVPPGTVERAAGITRRCIADSVNTIFEAAFDTAPFVTRADILKRSSGGWHVMEVKSSFSDTSSMADLVDDLAYTVMVLRRSGLRIVQASLLLLSREYRFGGGPERLFEVVDKTREVLKLAAEFDAVAVSHATALFDQAPPSPKLASVCRECAVFGDQCLGAGLAHTVLEIPGLHYKKLQQLSADGVVDMLQVPDDLKLNGRQQRAVKSSTSGQVVVETALGKALEVINWPYYYLDFETVATVLPLYADQGCHQQVLTQFSIHHRNRIDGELRQGEYLADAMKDCQRELAGRLIDDLGQHGSIMVYTGFEKTRIKGLQDLFPDLAQPLQAILDRLVDLHPIIADHVYHPEFRGSFSIKKVLPALVSDLSYEGLPIRDGEMAVTQFARMARGEIVGDEIETTRRQLLEYCKVDTLAMVRLHEKLHEMASSTQRPVRSTSN